MSDNADAKALKNLDIALELLTAELAYNKERLADKRISEAKAKFITLSLARIEREIEGISKMRAEVLSRLDWETRIADNMAH